MEPVGEVLATLRRLGGEPARIEAKRASGGLPKSLRETLSAFSNSDGGLIILGVDEQSGFEIVELSDPLALRDGLAQMSRDDITPALQITIEVVDFEDRRLVVAEVPAVSHDQRPVYVTSKGIAQGSYVRSGDGDRRMTDGEIAMVMTARTQPLYDCEAVEGTTPADLDQDALRRTLQRIRAGFPKSARADDPTLLYRLGITTGQAPDAALTLAGLLIYGEFPQQHFPQFMVSVVVHSTDTPTSTRFLDNQTIRGSIPEMIETTLAVIRRNLAVRAVIGEHGGRIDEIEYPIEAVREAVVNALMHRDYSPVTRGTQVQIELFPERLVIRSPGGLYGGVVVDELGYTNISSSRNARMASLLADTYLPSSRELVAENRASGIPAMLSVARNRGLPRPVFASTISSFLVTMVRSELLNPDTLRWIATLKARLPTPTHKIALAMLRENYLTNPMLREWGVDRITAGQVLKDLVDQGLVVKEGGRRYARYVLATDVSNRRGQPDLFTVFDESPRKQIATILRERSEATAADLAQHTGLSRVSVLRHLRALEADGEVLAVGASRSPRRKYRWTGSQED